MKIIVSNYYKILIKQCDGKIDGNIGLSYSFIIQNDVGQTGNFIFLNENKSLCQYTYINSDTRFLTFQVYDCCFLLISIFFH